MRKTIAVDVDLTVCDDVAHGWLDWLNAQSCKCYTLEDFEGVYDLTTRFPEVEDPFSYWLSNTLYDNAKPRQDALHCVNEICKHHDVIFVSHCMGDHYNSKKLFLERYFPNAIGFIGTNLKGYINCDVIVDDRLENLTCFNDRVTKYLFKAFSTNTNDIPGNIKVIDDWYQITENLLHF